MPTSPAIFRYVRGGETASSSSHHPKKTNANITTVLISIMIIASDGWKRMQPRGDNSLWHGFGE
ncbi:imidazole glycerol phosphate synthase [Anopheles sinensis]|uniref:Imidazole glycerol phosphate synthase n=1 Tax=Anopheles sinensis TaxID=74873 RepID=A0A084VH56_ANOSI|nr:imidazole glycerol phosphate synthase [Anopheles sinensis]